MSFTRETFMMLVWKITQFCMQSETHEDHEIKSLVLNNFCVKKGQGLKAFAVHLYPKYPSVSPRTSRSSCDIGRFN